MSYSHTTEKIWKDFFSFPELGAGSLCILKRNWLFFRKAWVYNIFASFIEPTLLILVVGMGLGNLMSGTLGEAYILFFSWAVICGALFFASFHEGSRGISFRYLDSREAKEIFLAPLSLEQILMGELLWSSVKGLIYAGVVFFVAALGPGLHLGSFFSFVCVSFLGSWMAASLGLLLLTITTRSTQFYFIYSGFLWPLFLVSDTIFPASYYSSHLDLFLWLSPVWHIIEPLRMGANGIFPSTYFLHIALLVIMCVLFTNLGVSRMSRQWRQPRALDLQ